MQREAHLLVERGEVSFADDSGVKDEHDRVVEGRPDEVQCQCGQEALRRTTRTQAWLGRPRHPTRWCGRRRRTLLYETSAGTTKDVVSLANGQRYQWSDRKSSDHICGTYASRTDAGGEKRCESHAACDAGEARRGITARAGACTPSAHTCRCIGHGKRLRSQRRSQKAHVRAEMDSKCLRVCV